MKTLRRRRPTETAAVEISWSHAGIAWRVTAWPEVAFQRRCGDAWLPEQPTEGAFAAAAAYVREPMWRRYLEFMPATERAFVAGFRFSRLEALQVISRCPELLPVLSEVPALTVFVAAHVALRGAERPGWDEIAAIFERAGLFGVLEWLGLPATRHALAALRNLADPEVPRRFLAPLRTLLWDASLASRLEQTPVVTDLDLARHCHRLAA
ncbi:hypothetical protein [Opitutus sp. ER46]|uniref:hypothetical protein n=1 Tax=Opitutus sp. ER46 TaxID=2161864 RepID=UPI000D314815|nr:hypothetical protein [Opitutus sp. ER46]PTX91321.1 hypothetical protein DB354_15605 [Opitutus sp. ER46]